MKITADTNLLVRSVMGDDKKQAAAANRLLKSAEVIAVTLPCLCEFVWVLLRVYGLSRSDITDAIRALLAASSVQADRQAAEAGLVMLENGGDFADGVIAHQGRQLGGTTFVSFDKQAVRQLHAAGFQARLA